MTAEDSFTAEDWHELELAPLWILAAVGAADGKIDKTERATLIEGVDRCAGHADEFVRRVFSTVSKNFDAIWTTYMQDERFAIHGLRTVGDVLARAADPVQALHFKQTLVQLGVDVADASGGVLGLGGKRSRAERKALNNVAQALRMPSRRLIAASQSSFDSILVPLDGSPESEAALSVARTIAAQFGSRVTLLDVVLEYRPIAPVAVEGYVAPLVVPTTEELHAAAVAYLDSVRSTYGAPEWQTVVVEGGPADVIVGQARQSGANLIVMATSGSAGLKRIFEGKVTEEVMRKADIPVLLVPLADDEF
jgi:nucleotide-binding universal stress UspA family protein